MKINWSLRLENKQINPRSRRYRENMYWYKSCNCWKLAYLKLNIICSTFHWFFYLLILHIKQYRYSIHNHWFQGQNYDYITKWSLLEESTALTIWTLGFHWCSTLVMERKRRNFLWEVSVGGKRLEGQEICSGNCQILNYSPTIMSLQCMWVIRLSLVEKTMEVSFSLSFIEQIVTLLWIKMKDDSHN